MHPQIEAFLQLALERGIPKVSFVKQRFNSRDNFWIRDVREAIPFADMRSIFGIMPWGRSQNWPNTWFCASAPEDLSDGLDWHPMRPISKWDSGTKLEAVVYLRD